MLNKYNNKSRNIIPLLYFFFFVNVVSWFILILCQVDKKNSSQNKSNIYLCTKKHFYSTANNMHNIIFDKNFV